jgi:hypothetical protein
MAKLRNTLLATALLVAVTGSLALRAGEGEAAKPPAKEEAAGAGGLKAKLIKKKISRRWRGRQRTWDTLVLEVVNEGEKAVVLPYPLEVTMGAKDAEGKEVPARELSAEQKAAEEKRKKEAEKKAVTLAVLKPKQKLETYCRRELYRLDFTKAGKCKVWAAVEIKPQEKEILPGVEVWSGKLKSNELEWEITRVRRERRQPQPKKEDPKKAPTKTEEF